MAVVRTFTKPPDATLRRVATHIEYESDETVRRIVHVYEDGSRKVIEGARLATVVSGTKTWQQLATALGNQADQESFS